MRPLVILLVLVGQLAGRAAGAVGEALPSPSTGTPCTATNVMRTVRVNYTKPSGSVATFVQALVGYRSNLVSLPRSGQAKSRVKNLPQGATPIVNDVDHALQVTLQSRSGTSIDDGALFTVAFDSCKGAHAPTPADFSCQIVQCSSSFGDISGCACTVSFP